MTVSNQAVGDSGQGVVVVSLPIAEDVHEAVRAAARLHCPTLALCSGPRAGHTANLERPDLVNPAIRAFLREAWA